MYISIVHMNTLMFAGAKQQSRTEHTAQDRAQACQSERDSLVEELSIVRKKLKESQHWKSQYHEVEIQYISLLNEFQSMLTKLVAIEDEVFRSVLSVV